MRKLKNCYYKKIKDSEIGHYFEIYDLNKKHITDVLLYDTVLTYNKYKIINE